MHHQTVCSRWFVSVLVASLAWLLAVPALADAPRTWTSRTGQTLEGDFERLWNDVVYLKGKDGGAIRIALKDLSEADQQFIRQKSQPAAALAEGSGGAVGDVPAKIKELFGATLVNAGGDKVPVGQLAGKTIGVYFSAHWCPPCRGFTPSLVKFHEDMKAAGKPFEVVFVSSDRDLNAMRGYMREYKMPWLAVPFGSKEQKSLGGQFGVKGIPMLVILDSEGRTVSTNGRAEVGMGASAFDRWTGK